MKKIVKFILLGLTCFCFVLSGCNKVEETEVVEEKIIGEKIEGDNVYIVNVINSTDKTIKDVSIKSNVDEYCDNMLKEDFIADEERVLYYDATNAIKENENQSDSEMETSPEYTIRLKFDDESEFELHSFPFEDLKKVEIKLEDDVAFIEYTSIQQDKLVSTKEAELKIKSDSKQEELEQENVGEQNEPVVQETVQYPVYENTQGQDQVVVQPPVSSGGDSSNEGCLGDEVDTW